MNPGYRQLAHAVIHRAFLDLKAGWTHPKDRMTAEQFLAQTGPRSVLAFWCAVAGLDMSRVRAVLLKRKRQPWAS